MAVEWSRENRLFKQNMRMQSIDTMQFHIGMWKSREKKNW